MATLHRPSIVTKTNTKLYVNPTTQAKRLVTEHVRRGELNVADGALVDLPGWEKDLVIGGRGLLQ